MMRNCHPEGSAAEQSEAARSRRIHLSATEVVALGILRLRGFRTKREIRSAQDDSAKN